MRKRIRSERDLYNWLFEQEEAEEGPDPLTAEKIQKLWQLDYPAFVEELKKVAKDKKLRAFLAAGREDGTPGDESISVIENTIVAANTLSPTQSEIDLGKSVGYPFKNPGAVNSIVGGGGPWVGGDPIIICGNKVIDGHHRWSQVYVMNPERKLLCINIKVKNPVLALKMTQAAIAITQKNVPSQKVEPGMNIYAMSFDEIIQKFATPGSGAEMPDHFVNDCFGKINITATPEEIEKVKTTAPPKQAPLMDTGTTPNVPKQKTFTTMGGEVKNIKDTAKAQQAAIDARRAGASSGEQLSLFEQAQTAGDYLEKYAPISATIAHNCMLLKTNAPAGQFSRAIMPQTGEGDGGPGPAGLKASMESGEINYKPGYDISGGGGAEVQKESLNENRIRRIHLPGIHRSRS